MILFVFNLNINKVMREKFLISVIIEYKKELNGKDSWEISCQIIARVVNEAIGSLLAFSSK